MTQSVIIYDKTVRLALRVVLEQVRGHRKCPPIDRFLEWKKGRLDDVWRAKGMNESGGRGTWEPNAKSTTIQKFGIGYDQPTPFEGGVMHKKRRDVPMSLRRAKILEKTGKLRATVTCARSKREGGQRLVIKAPGLGKYPYYHLVGHSGMIHYKRAHWRKRWPDGRGKGKRPTLERIEQNVSAFIEYPARPWGVWLNSDQKQLARELERHFGRVIGGK